MIEPTRCIYSLLWFYVLIKVNWENQMFFLRLHVVLSRKTFEKIFYLSNVKFLKLCAINLIELFFPYRCLDSTCHALTFRQKSSSDITRFCQKKKTVLFEKQNIRNYNMFGNYGFNTNTIYHSKWKTARLLKNHRLNLKEWVSICRWIGYIFVPSFKNVYLR